MQSRESDAGSSAASQLFPPLRTFVHPCRCSRRRSSFILFLLRLKPSLLPFFSVMEANGAISSGKRSKSVGGATDGPTCNDSVCLRCSSPILSINSRFSPPPKNEKGERKKEALPSSIPDRQAGWQALHTECLGYLDAGLLIRCFACLQIHATSLTKLYYSFCLWPKFLPLIADILHEWSTCF